ncbi:hypothetical protein AY498_10385 [Corynebacterium ulcerans]|uniref:Primosomal protein n=1 Tax=Corynebacterium ulcerans FRC58 TaxID=1408268 RepID=A0ABN4GVZ1_CORUL|nr:hypothetical protein [Corynebacterium ulcerans]AIT88503.1 Hypothetical protein Cul210932_0539 [Corynebacterium ulcerans]AIU29881.1 Hypothetical protein Cul210931_0520 [Corynebacterium ulcerans]AIU91138.1 Hypothetical protein Cul05146_0553 [Corynebacterium ulcerans]AKN76434.1 Hypothetical protein CulFRC58_0580 [Corynebacterium ulcerans FRC58]ALD94270.1 Hypothetical protein Cul131001_0545 [Corynebacterium ulcerans]
MANKGIVPVKLSLTEGDFYTLWAPEWREHGAEWQAFLGKDDDLYVFASPEELLLFLESGTKHDLNDHPKWNSFNAGAANRVVPTARQEFDIVGTPQLLAERPSYDNVSAVARNFKIARSLGDVTGTTDILVFFSSHSILSNPERGVDHFAGENGLGEWSAIGRVVLSNWDTVVDSLDNLITIKDVTGDSASIEDASTRIKDAEEAARVAREKAEEEKKANAEKVDPYDTTAWAASGIDPIKVSIDGRTLYTLRTYVEAQPVFLGKFGEIFTFSSSKALLRWLVEHDDHDLAKVSTWEDLMVPLNAGELDVTVHSDNVYSFNGLSRDINSSVDAVDTAQMARAYELLADAADWAADDSLNSYFLANPRMQDYISYMLGSSETSGYTPTPPFDDHAEGWKELEAMLTKRFSKF